MMKNTHLGFLTSSSLIAAVVTALLVAGFGFVKGGMLFSPDALNAQTGAPLGGVSSHAEIGGQCSLCHAPFWSNSTMADKCVVCHTDVASQWQDPSTLHGVLRQNNPNLDCRNCHPDHRGPTSPLLDLSNVSFLHNSFNYSLTGHKLKTDSSPFGCNDCHAKVYTGFDVNICTTCHYQKDAAFVQTHVLDFGTDCLTCHDGVDTYGHNFDHNSAPFQLAGKHSQLQCAQCHVNTRSIADFQATPQDCNSCHAQKDVHQGRLGADCGSCHTPADWTSATFDHNLSTFKLDGLHASVACGDCHLHRILQGTPTDCFSCHAPKDVHQGSEGTDCSSCHSTAGWKPATYDHNLSAFKLTGQHTTAACENCHINNVLKGTPTDCFSCHATKDTHQGSLGKDCGSCHSTDAWKPATYNHNLSVFKLTGQHVTVACLSCHVNNVFKGTPTDCYSCHAKQDNHNGQLGTNCGTCHSTSGWKPATYDHNLSSFKLTGQHVNVSCASCHVNNVFKGTPTDCYSCHAKQDNHNGQLGTNCGTCHSTNGWKPATFDHNISNFKLTGQHVNVACTSCHINSVFKGTPTDCYSCHAKQDNHNGQFGTNCGSCHSTSGWKPATFDHNISSFKLTGKHVNVACTSCHINGVFKGTPTDCYSCHASQDNHNGQFGTNCGSCHTTSGWTPATFDHNISSFKLTGKHVNVACSSCHINGVFKGTPTDCYSCHASQDNHNGQLGTNCGSCHTTSGWTPATFDHSTSGFPLTGAHTSLSCTQCHTNGTYKGLSTDCVSCHSEPSGHFGSNCASCHTTSNWNATYNHSGFPLTGAHTNLSCTQCHTNGTYSGLSTDCVSCHSEPSGHFGTNCASCHTTSNWNATYNHSSSGFPLTGAHTSLSCTQCHTNGSYSGLSPDCVSCHAEPSGHFGTNCASCHTTSNWNATYNHSGFPLTGAHSSLSCTQCHTNGSYSGLSTACASCHSAPGTHAGLSTDCTQCHSTSNWSANFTHPGGCDGDCSSHKQASCADCHPANYPTYTCLKCHSSNHPGN